MASQSDDHVLIPLRGGPAVPLGIIRRLLDLEDRGIVVTIRPDGTLFVGPRARVHADDLDFVRQHRDLVLAAVSYCDRCAEAPL